MGSFKQIRLISGDNIFTTDSVSLESPYITVRGFMSEPAMAYSIIKMRKDDPVAGAQQLAIRAKFMFDIPRTSIVFVEELD